MVLSQTPSFKRPPVYETALGFAFAPIEKWSIPHYGLFWNKVRDQFPKFQVLPPIAAPQLQKPGQHAPQVRFEIRAAPEVRCWFVSENDAELIQVQPDRFLVNWRSTEKNLSYPRYHARMRPLFEKYWGEFRSFLSAEQLGDPSVVQCELTYINHILRGEGWESAADWHQVFTMCYQFGGHGFLPDPDSRQFSLNYPMTNDAGSLNIVATRAIRVHDSREVVKFELSARGRPTNNDDSQLFDWLDLAHEWVVRGFAELTTEEMHKRWEREV